MEFVDGNFYKVAAFNQDTGDKIGILGKDGAIIIKPSRSHSYIEYYEQYKAFIMLEEDGSWRVLKYTFR
jgi:hypothetical protein